MLQKQGITQAVLFTLRSHEVSKVPDEFSNNKLLPFLIKDVVVTLQDQLLVLLSEHHGWILQREIKLVKQSDEK